MISFETIQQSARDLIAANAYFAGENVVKDQGTSDPEIEKALRERGFCTVIEPVLAGKVTSQGGKISGVHCELFVQIQLNPKINKDVAQKDIYVGIKSIVAALTAPNPINPNDRFALKADGNAIELSSFDPGLWAYDLSFTKTAVL